MQKSKLQTSDSTAGMTGAIEGTCDIGMASRELKDSESATLTATPIALDGIAVIVNPQNPNRRYVNRGYKGHLYRYKDNVE